MPPPVSEPAVLGIDAAWTLSEPSGVALWQRVGVRWSCLRVAPSYAGFCGRIAWDGEISGGAINVREILETCRRLLGGALPIVVAVSIPLARAPITTRRSCDTLINTRFHQRKCSIQGPTPQRPGAVGLRLHRGFTAAGFELVTTRWTMPPASLIEVYPHVALLGLMNRPERVPYKVHKTQTYWPGLPRAVRRRKLVDEWQAIVSRLGRYVEGVDIPLRANPETLTFRRLKQFEAAIDALVCAWMAAEFWNGTARRMGDTEAAIWIPQAALRYAKAPFDG